MNSWVVVQWGKEGSRPNTLEEMDGHSLDSEYTEYPTNAAAPETADRKWCPMPESIPTFRGFFLSFAFSMEVCVEIHNTKYAQ